MAVTQYIGARYVPLFSDPIEWNSNNAYEPLTVVTYQGASYTSKQAVPVGIDITNTQYWALTGNYNAQVEQYRQEVRNFDNRITAAQSAAEDAQSTAEDAQSTADTNTTAISNEVTARTNADNQIRSDLSDEIDSEIATVNTSITNANTRITNEITARTNADATLSNRISALENASETKEHIAIFGDSYLMGVHSDSASSGSTNYGQYINSWLSSKYDIDTYAQGGIGFWRVSSESGTWSGMNYAQMVTNVANTYTDALKQRTTKVLIQGGYNDANHINQYNTQAITNAITSARNNFPNAQIYVAFVWGAGRPFSVNAANAYSKYLNDSKWNGVSFGESININFALTTPSYDNIHPTASQQHYIAGLIYDLIMDGWNGDYIVGAPNDNNSYNVMLDAQHIAHVRIEHTLENALTPSSGNELIGTSNIRPALSYFTGNTVTSNPWMHPVLRFNNQGQCHIMHVDENINAGEKIYGSFEYSIVAF